MFKDFSKTQIIIFAICCLGCLIALTHDKLFISFCFLIGQLITIVFALKKTNVDGDKFPNKINIEEIC